MRYVIRQPAPPLRDFIEHFWLLGDEPSHEHDPDPEEEQSPQRRIELVGRRRGHYRDMMDMCHGTPPSTVVTRRSDQPYAEGGSGGVKDR